MIFFLIYFFFGRPSECVSVTHFFALVVLKAKYMCAAGVGEKKSTGSLLLPEKTPYL